MILTVDRKWKKSGYTIGNLYIDGVQFCNTLEDTDRGLDDSMTPQKIVQMKIKGETAIPKGRYFITLAMRSPKFSASKYVKQYGFCKGYLPRLLNVKGYDGVLIHAGSNADHTEGCVLVGRNTIKGGLTQSTATFKALYEKMEAAKKKGETITIVVK